MGEIPQDLHESVFVLGILSEAEELKSKTGKHFEGIGGALAKGCPDNGNELWGDALLEHNHVEVERITLSVNPFLFGV